MDATVQRILIIRPSIIWNLDYLAWQLSFKKCTYPLNVHAHCSCYYGDKPAYLLSMRRQQCSYYLSGWIILISLIAVT